MQQLDTKLQSDRNDGMHEARDDYYHLEEISI
jgi:hypothetical protein